MAGQSDADGTPKLPRLIRDRASKAVFQCAEPVEHAVSFVLSGMEQGPEWLERMDFQSLAQLPTETIDPWLKAGYQDVAWRLKVRSADGAAPEWLRLLILIELQTTVEYDMALRVQGYMQRMHEEAWRGLRVRRTDRLPPVLAVVFYDGSGPWRAERSVWGLTEKRALRRRDREVKRMPVGLRYELVDVQEYADKPLSKAYIFEQMLSAELMGEDFDAAAESILEAQGRLLGRPDQRQALERMRRWTRLTFARTGVDLEVLDDMERTEEIQRSGRMLSYLEARAQRVHAKLRAEAAPRHLPRLKSSVCRI